MKKLGGVRKGGQGGTRQNSVRPKLFLEVVPGSHVPGAQGEKRTMGYGLLSGRAWIESGSEGESWAGQYRSLTSPLRTGVCLCHSSGPGTWGASCGLMGPI